ncbi:hypothetical protein BDV40DRAFT_19059 [Aspergillus tamarii]|uniref:Uncharacterized protein n=1 Tax=Aspergillus tamarii TaxID=41984 RepID=A0A5N6UIZ6_ASPTM|nr:hypothetical protein BDV40DRAFT_19059 [Aspergillus tamarii]
MRSTKNSRIFVSSRVSRCKRSSLFANADQLRHSFPSWSGSKNWDYVQPTSHTAMAFEEGEHGLYCTTLTVALLATKPSGLLMIVVIRLSFVYTAFGPRQVFFAVGNYIGFITSSDRPTITQLRDCRVYHSSVTCTNLISIPRYIWMTSWCYLEMNHTFTHQMPILYSGAPLTAITTFDSSLYSAKVNHRDRIIMSYIHVTYHHPSLLSSLNFIISFSIDT